MNKIKVGIFFGGQSREREVSFAGGRTVYDSLNKALFEAVPVFVDSFGQFILLDWQYIYKGSIRDFYPPLAFTPPSDHEFQVYAENCPLSDAQQAEMAASVGKILKPDAFKDVMDVAFLCLHGSGGEDGTIQGMLDFYGIPYTGSGVLSSAIGMNKAVQKHMMQAAGFQTNVFICIKREEWKVEYAAEFLTKAIQHVGNSMVIKAANQGSSIGISLLQQPSLEAFYHAVNKAFFIREISMEDYGNKSLENRVQFLRELCDIREGIGLPALVNGSYMQHPEELWAYLEHRITKEDFGKVLMEALDAESEVLIEAFVEGKEFSCIVIEDTNGKPVALPPTEIRKGKEVFDYRSKYLPGLSRKITPIELPVNDINRIRAEVESLYGALHFGVYARIDGFFTTQGGIILNDPNTTSGMMPSSFFFHQAAEIGLNPSQFITYILFTSIKVRLRQRPVQPRLSSLLKHFQYLIQDAQLSVDNRMKVGVILGGYSSERHISVESGRNVYEKLSSSEKYQPVPLFLSGNERSFTLHTLPVNLLLKDNADDIREKIEHFEVHPILSEIVDRCKGITHYFSNLEALTAPRKVPTESLPQLVSQVFIALHGRPGEDGALQKELDNIGLPYNGSGVNSSQLTINKFATNELLMKHGLNAARHLLLWEEEWQKNAEAALKRITDYIPFPFIAKPVDDGCSSAVKKIKKHEEFRAFAELMFRKTEALDEKAAHTLHIRPKEEFPMKTCILIEELISQKDAAHFLEITGGMLTKLNEKGERIYEVFEASEALSEGEVLSLEEKFLAGQGQNITPARYHSDAVVRQQISDAVKVELEKAARILDVEGYCRIDAFVRVYDSKRAEVIFIEVNSLPGMTPATCIFHQAALGGYKPYEFIDHILTYGKQTKTALHG